MKDPKRYARFHSPQVLCSDFLIARLYHSHLLSRLLMFQTPLYTHYISPNRTKNKENERKTNVGLQQIKDTRFLCNIHKLIIKKRENRPKKTKYKPESPTDTNLTSLTKV